MKKNRFEVKSFYQEQKENHLSQLEVTRKQIRQTAVLRISIFLLTLIGIFAGTNWGWPWVIGFAVIGFGYFIFLALKHARLFKQKNWHETLVGINNKELQLLKGNTEGQDEGKEFADAEHPFTFNLDIFGKRSLFQLINRTSTRGGTHKLAEILNHPFKDIETLKKRQKAIAELGEKPEWRQRFQATGMLSNQNDGVSDLVSWATEKPSRFQSKFYSLMIVLNPLIGIVILILIGLGIINYTAFLLFLLLPLAIIGPQLNNINILHSLLSKKSESFQKYSLLFDLIEQEGFQSELLINAKNKLSGEPNSAHLLLKKLSKITAAFDYRLNILVGFTLNIIFLWDILQIRRLDNWKSRHHQQVKSWFEVLEQYDELNSFAGFAFNFPEAVFPVFSENFEIRGEEVAHPFIAPEDNVGNEVLISGWGQFHIVTGANMAGKSTYLRTVGINLIMAMTGLPVLAKSFRFQPVNLFTGIKTSDSLQDGESYFFAELKRLKNLIDRLEDGQQLFVILDEILRGTNSADKQKGSLGLLQQLIRLQASGMIATHDLALGGLIKSYPNHITNKRFEVEIENNELLFDYKLKDGISQNLNATFLMKKMGITLE